MRLRKASTRNFNHHKRSLLTDGLRRRRQLEQAGWNIMLSIGDQPSDMLGGYTDSGFLLPNPMYLIP